MTHPRTFRSASRGLSVTTAASASAILILALSFGGCSYAVIGAGTSDYVSTRYAISRGAVEANPLAGQGAVRQAVVKVAGISGVLGAAYLLERKDKKTWSQIVKASAIVIWGAATIVNVYRVR